MSMTTFSVLLPVYRGDEPDLVDDAISSVLDQTVEPDEVVIIADGPVPQELDEIVKSYQNEYDCVKCLEKAKNDGLGKTLQLGVKKCSNDIIARMDSDDISLSHRFEKQIEILTENEDIDVVGAHMAEHLTSSGKFENVRKVPETQEQIWKQAKKRNPMNHPTVMFRKKSVIESGNYSKLRLIQDYELWGRMLAQEYNFYNIQDVLVVNNSSEEVITGRGGIKYLKYEILVAWKLWSYGVISGLNALVFVTVRAPIRVIPKPIRKRIYYLLLRD